MLGRCLSLVLATLVGLTLISGCGSNGDTTSTSAVPTPIERLHLLGSWTGELHQQGLAPFTVQALLLSLTDPSRNRVDYTGIDCGGNWTYLGREGQAYRFREVINRGSGGNCKGVGEVNLTPTPGKNPLLDKLDYVFRGGGVESTGVLHRNGNADVLTSKVPN